VAWTVFSTWDPKRPNAVPLSPELPKSFGVRQFCLKLELSTAPEELAMRCVRVHAGSTASWIECLMQQYHKPDVVHNHYIPLLARAFPWSLIFGLVLF
jgi:hypothetical protein